MRSSIPHERITNSIIEHAKLTTTYGKPRKASTPSAYYHFKSADWEQNKPFKLASFTAGELAKMPTYYIMDLDKGMAETAAPEMPLAAAIAGCKWLPDKELAVYATEWDRTGFQGGNEGLSRTSDSGCHQRTSRDVGAGSGSLETLRWRIDDFKCCLGVSLFDSPAFNKPGRLGLSLRYRMPVKD